MKIRIALIVISFGLAIGIAAQGRGGRGPQQPLDIGGNWTGT